MTIAKKEIFVTDAFDMKKKIKNSNLTLTLRGTSGR